MGLIIGIFTYFLLFAILTVTRLVPKEHEGRERNRRERVSKQKIGGENKEKKDVKYNIKTT